MQDYRLWTFLSNSPDQFIPSVWITMYLKCVDPLTWHTCVLLNISLQNQEPPSAAVTASTRLVSGSPPIRFSGKTWLQGSAPVQPQGVVSNGLEVAAVCGSARSLTHRSSTSCLSCCHRHAETGTDRTQTDVGAHRWVVVWPAEWKQLWQTAPAGS